MVQLTEGWRAKMHLQTPESPQVGWSAERVLQGSAELEPERETERERESYEVLLTCRSEALLKGESDL